MGRFLLRVWLPDRPGALGAVASRIGAVGGDVVGIEILERDGGRAIDELVVELHGEGLEGLLLAELAEVDGAAVEELRPLGEELYDRELAVLEAAVVLLGEPAAALPGALCRAAVERFRASWAAVVDRTSAVIVEAVGEPPPAGWMLAFVGGSGAAPEIPTGVAPDVADAELAGTDFAVLIGREHPPIHERERRELAALARITATALTRR